MRLYTTLRNINEMCTYNNNNKHFGKIEKTLQINIIVNYCVGLTQSSVIWIIHRNVGLKCFFNFHLLKCLLLSLGFLTFMFHRVV